MQPQRGSRAGAPRASPTNCGSCERDAKHRAFPSSWRISLRGNPPPPSPGTSQRQSPQLDGGLRAGRGEPRAGGELRAPLPGAQTAWPPGQRGRTGAPAEPERAEYLSEEAGDHLLEGVLEHLVHVHGDPHPCAPTTPPPADCGGSSDRAGPQTTKPGKPKGRGGFFSAFFKLSKLYCPLGKTDSWHAPFPFPVPFRQSGRQAREVPGPRAVSARGVKSGTAPPWLRLLPSPV